MIHKNHKLSRPRFIQRIWAFVFGYFWLPCPICGTYFGGHEWKYTGQSLEDGGGFGRGVCPECIKEAQHQNSISRSIREGADFGDSCMCPSVFWDDLPRGEWVKDSLSRPGSKP